MIGMIIELLDLIANHTGGKAKPPALELAKEVTTTTADTLTAETGPAARGAEKINDPRKQR